MSLPAPAIVKAPLATWTEPGCSFAVPISSLCQFCGSCATAGLPAMIPSKMAPHTPRSTCRLPLPCFDICLHSSLPCCPAPRSRVYASSLHCLWGTGRGFLRGTRSVRPGRKEPGPVRRKIPSGLLQAAGNLYDNPFRRPSRLRTSPSTEGARRMTAPPFLSTLVATLIVIAGVVLVVRQTDVRLVLFTCGLVLAALAGRPLAAFDKFAETMVNPSFVLPICCSMGFAFVLKFTGCDAPLVRLLVAPLRRVGPLVVPGAVLVPFVVNTAVISQSSTAATVGPVLIPLLLAAGLSPGMAGTPLLVGSSVRAA